MASAPVVTETQEVPKPEFIVKMHNDYRAKIAHVFILYGNIHDFPDNSGNRHAINRTLALEFDSFVKKDITGSAADDSKSARGANYADEVAANTGTPSVMATYSMSQGLDFAHPNGREAFVTFLQEYYGEEVTGWRDDWQNPSSFEAMIWVLNRWFAASKEVVKSNKMAKRTSAGTRKELKFTILFNDADVLFPSGDIASLGADRMAIVNVRQWARDEQIGDRNRVILMTRHMSDIHESIRGGTMGISSHMVPKPTLEDREAWLTSFDANLRRRTAKKPLIIGSNEVRNIEMVEGFTFHDFSVQAAGMSRRQMEDVVMSSWLNKEPIDFPSVRDRKQRALEDEYSGILDFYEPEYGFEQIGGHDNLKNYFKWNIIDPLRNNDRRLCSKGVLMTGPPGCQPAGSQVLMADGSWKNVEDVRVGDLVVSPQHDGSSMTATVTETVVYPQRPVYGVATRGRTRKSYRCADNHIIPYLALERPRTPIAQLVGYQSSGERGSVLSKYETKRPARQTVLHERQAAEFLERGLNYRNKARIFTTPAVDFPEQMLTIPPYVMGAMLGDGSFLSQPNFTNGNPRLFRHLEQLGVEFGYENVKDTTVTRNIIGESANQLRACPVWGQNSYSKFVPAAYKRGSLEQRLQLLAGLIDTDGSIDSYTTCSEQLARDFADLVHSVGGFASYRPRITRDQNGTECLSYRVHYAFAEHLPGLTESHKSQGPRNMEWKNPRTRGFEITYQGIEDVFGFVLDSPSEWYITDDWLVTHNTGKTAIAKALAKEAKMNFMIAHLDKVFGGLVGETEKRTRKLLEAIDSAAPVIVFIDELDSVLSSGRSSQGDSGVSSRVFNSIMTWLSDESRAGRVVAVSASNRPDLLDSALIRSGRFDAKIPALPPSKGDSKGRGQILEALTKKYKLKFAKEMRDTEKNHELGLGLLMLDDQRVWTGAEIEVVLKKALQISARNGEKAVSVDSWTRAFKFVLPNTQEVERMSLLSLLYVDDLEFCPVEWREIAGDKKKLRADLQGLGWDEED